MALDRLAIRATSAVSPVGYDVRQMCASIRADISRFREEDEFSCLSADPDVDEPEEPVVLSLSPRVARDLEDRERLTALVLHCFQDLVQVCGADRAALRKSAFLLALPQEDEAVTEWKLADFGDAIFRHLGVDPPAAMECDRTGHAGFLNLLPRAFELLESRVVDGCIIGGADTYCSAARLAYLDDVRRLKSSRNPDGFIPGEAASLIWVGAPERDGGLASVGRPGLGVEPQIISGDRQSTGKGLTESLRSLEGDGPWGQVYCDLNGESYRSAEWGVVLGRLAGRFAENFTLVHPADCLGDVGAASGPILLSCVVAAFRQGYATDPRALIWTASDGGRRAAVTAAAPGGNARN